MNSERKPAETTDLKADTKTNDFSIEDGREKRLHRNRHVKIYADELSFF